MRPHAHDGPRSYLVDLVRVRVRVRVRGRVKVRVRVRARARVGVRVRVRLRARIWLTSSGPHARESEERAWRGDN